MEEQKTIKAPRLHVRGTILGYRRNRVNQHPNQALIKIADVASREDAHFYVGKRIAYYYKAKTERNGSKLRVTWGRIIRVHGNSGVVRAKFRRNLTGSTFGQTCRVFLFPSHI